MKKVLILMSAIPLIFLSCEVEKLDSQESLSAVEAKARKQNLATLSFEDPANCTATETNLIAGQNTVVGTVSVSVVGANYIITYDVEDGYCLTETHLSVVETAADFPTTPSGNPKNGNFEFSDTHGCVNSYSYEVPTSKGNFIAAHGVVTCISDSADDLPALPETLSFCILSQGESNGSSYFILDIDGESILAGELPAWCIDADSRIQNLECYDAEVLSSYGDLSGIDFADPDNLDLVNWILNQTWEAPYTFGDIQQAIWILLEGGDGCPECAGVGDASPERAQEIANMALEYGEGYEPGCGEYAGIILLPVNPDATSEDRIQPLIIPYKLQCNECEETVWADGCGFPGANWAMYFYFPDAI